MNADTSPTRRVSTLSGAPPAALRRSQMVRDYEKHFNEATGLALNFIKRGIPRQVLLEKPTKSRFSTLVEQLLKFGLQPELPALEDAWFHTRVLSREQFDASVGLLSVVARHLSELAEPIHMPDAAHHVHLSAAYFCKMFKHATGMTFTECLSRARGEKASG